MPDPVKSKSDIAGKVDESERGRTRLPSGAPDAGAIELRYTGEPGVTNTSTTTLDRTWWIATAAAIFSRMPHAPGAGEGTSPQQNETLADKLIEVFGPISGNYRNLAKVFGVDSGNKDELRDRVVADLAAIATPAANAWIAAPSQLRVYEQPSAANEVPSFGPAVAPPPQALKRRPTGYYPSESKCIHDRRFSNDGRLRCVTNHRLSTYETFRQAPQMKGLRRQLQARADVQQQLWAERYRIAAYIAGRAESPEDISDDYYSMPPNENWGGLPSEKMLGIAVHEALQERYLGYGRHQSHDIVSEIDQRVYLFRATQGGKRPAPQPFWDLIPEDESRDELGELAFSLGSRSWHLRPDLVDLTSRQIVEIKPIRSLHKGVLQLWRYVSNFRLARAWDDLVYPSIPERPIYELAPGGFPQQLLARIPLYERLKKTGMKPGDLKKYKDYWAQPMMINALPGLVFYTLHNEQQPKVPSIIRSIAKGILIAAAIAIIAVLLVKFAPALLQLSSVLIAALKAVADRIELITDGGPIRLPTREASIPDLRLALASERSQIAAQAKELVLAAR